MAEYIDREKRFIDANKLYDFIQKEKAWRQDRMRQPRYGQGKYDAYYEMLDIINEQPTADVQEVNKIVEFINIAINGTPSKTDYDIGLRNGLKLALSVIDGKEPDFEKCSNNETVLPLTHQELKHLINDLISYIWKLEDKGLDKAEFGYFSRKELLEKLKQFEKDNFQPMAESPYCGAKMDGDANGNL